MKLLRTQQPNKYLVVSEALLIPGDWIVEELNPDYKMEVISIHPNPYNTLLKVRFELSGEETIVDSRGFYRVIGEIEGPIKEFNPKLERTV
jgi:hypothetical protein